MSACGRILQGNTTDIDAGVLVKMFHLLRNVSGQTSVDKQQLLGVSKITVSK